MSTLAFAKHTMCTPTTKKMMLSSWLTILTSISLVFWILWRMNYGLDLTDESYCLICISSPNSFLGISLFAHFISPLYKLINGNIVLLRKISIIFGLILSYISISWTIRNVKPSNKESIKKINFYENKFEFSLCTCIFSIATFMDGWFPSPTYNTLAIYATMLIYIGICSIHNENRTSSLIASWMFIGSSAALLALIKISSAVIILFILLLYMSFFTRRKKLSLYAVFSSILTCSFFLYCKDWSLPYAFFYIKKSFISYKILTKNISATSLFRIDTFPYNNANITYGVIFGLLLSLYHKSQHADRKISLISIDGYNKAINQRKNINLKLLKNFYYRTLIHADYVLKTSSSAKKIFTKSMSDRKIQFLFKCVPIAFSFLTLFYIAADIQRSQIPPYTNILGNFPSFGYLSWICVFFIYTTMLIVEFINFNWKAWKIILTLLLLLILPFCIAFGSNVNYWYQGAPASIFWIFGIIIIRHKHKCLIRTSTIAPIIQFFIVIFTLHSMQAPFMQDTPLYTMQKKITLTSTGTTVIVSDNIYHYLSNFQILTQKNAFTPGTGLLNFTGQYPGIALAAGGESLGSPWFFGHPEYDKNQFAQYSLSRVPAIAIQKAWLLVAPETEFAISTSVLKTYGIDLKKNYTFVGELHSPRITYSGGTRQLLYKPKEIYKCHTEN